MTSFNPDGSETITSSDGVVISVPPLGQPQQVVTQQPDGSTVITGDPDVTIVVPPLEQAPPVVTHFGDGSETILNPDGTLITVPPLLETPAPLEQPIELDPEFGPLLSQPGFGTGDITPLIHIENQRDVDEMNLTSLGQEPEPNFELHDE